MIDDDNHSYGGSTVETQGVDVNRFTLERILPGAAELCEQGQLNATKLERDPNRFQRRVIDCYYVTEMRDVNGLMLPVTFVETCERQTLLPRLDKAPVSVPILRGPTAISLHWALRMFFLRQKTFGYGKAADDEARRMATTVEFRVIGSKDSSRIQPGVIAL